MRGQQGGERGLQGGPTCGGQSEQGLGVPEGVLGTAVPGGCCAQEGCDCAWHGQDTGPLGQVGASDQETEGHVAGLGGAGSLDLGIQVKVSRNTWVLDKRKVNLSCLSPPTTMCPDGKERPLPNQKETLRMAENCRCLLPDVFLGLVSERGLADVLHPASSSPHSLTPPQEQPRLGHSPP